MVPDHLAQLSVGLRVGDQEVDVGISDRVAGQRLRRALEGKGAFRRFRNVLYERHPDLISVWHVMREARARVRAVQWLADEDLIDEDAARRFARDHPEPKLP
jgi:hypothetical protein